MGVGSTEEFVIDVRADLSQLKTDMANLTSLMQGFATKTQAASRKAAPAIGTVERQIKNLNTQIMASSSKSQRLFLQLRKDMLNMSNILLLFNM